MHEQSNAVRGSRTLGELYESAAALWPDRAIAFPDTGCVLTYAGLVERAMAIAGALQARGVAPGALVGFVQANDPEFLLSFLAISLAGAVPTPLPLPASASGIPAFVARLRGIVADAGMRRVIVSSLLAGHLARLGSALQDLGEVEPITCAALEAEGATLRRPDISPEALALVQYTSGSTSAPKGVALRHRHVLAAIEAIGRGIALGPDDVNGQWLPLFHDMGLVGTLTGIAHGTAHYLWQPTTFIRRPDRWLRDFAAAGASIYAGPSFSYAYMIDATPADAAAGLDLRRWRVAFNGAESIDPHIMERFARHFAAAGFRRSTMFPVYGLAEATLAVAFPALGDEPTALWVDRQALAAGRVVEAAAGASDARGVVCVGAPIEGHEIRIAPAGGGAEPGDDQVGEIEVRGPAVMDGYYRAEPLAPASDDGWLATGDLGFVRGGRLYVTGRIKQMLIVRGQNYYPEDVEATVRGVAGVHKGRSVAVLGEAIGSATDAAIDAVVSVIAETTVDPADARTELTSLAHRIHDAVRDHLGLPVGRVVLVRERSIRRTTNGKYQRLLMAQLLRDGELAGDILCDFVPRLAG
jgi:acyl-CoA synthetase (AMP-forming)/AMP-acid ligase II